MSQPIKIFEIQPQKLTADIIRGSLTNHELQACADMQRYYCIDGEAEAAKIALLRNTAVYHQYETWADIDAGCGVNVILHYGAPPVCYPLELRYRDIFEFEMIGLFAGIYDHRIADPFSMRPVSDDLMARGHQAVHQWTMQLFKSRFVEDGWIDFELLNQRLYVCLDEENYEIVKKRANHIRYQGHYDLGVPSEKYSEYMHRRKYLLLN